MKQYYKSYMFTLSDGRTWGFSADERIGPWLESFAKIMQLRQCSETDPLDVRVVFIAYRSSEEPPFESVGYKWDVFKSGSIFRVWHNDNSIEIFVELEVKHMDNKDIRIINMWNSLKPLFRYYTENGGGPMHAAFTGLDGKGILIAAPGNTGKTTSMSRLPDYYDKVSDDAVLIVKSKDAYNVHPLPTWSDYHCNRKESTFNIQSSLPLKAIFFLEQADEDQIIPIESETAALEIFDSIKQSWTMYWHRMDNDKKKERQLQALDNSISLAKSIPCYRLRATLHGQFWKEIEKELQF
jgi:SynChlorMet cassette protein ScmC